MLFVRSKSLCYEYLAGVGMDRFFFFGKPSFRFENDKRTKNEMIVFRLKNIVFKKRSFSKTLGICFLKTVVFKNDRFFKLPLANENPLLTTF